MAAGSTNRIFFVETKTVLLTVFNVLPLLMFIVMFVLCFGAKQYFRK